MMMRWKRKAMERFGDSSLMERLFPNVSKSKILLKFIFIVLAFCLLVIGIANPQIGTRLETVKREGVDIMIALDISNSMLAEDIMPNRMERSKQAIYRLIEKLDNDRIGIIIFAGRAYVQLPLTTDMGAAKLFLSNINTDIIPAQGTAIGDAIELAAKSFGSKDKKHKALIIITDGENHEDDAISEAKKASEEGVIIHTIGMGSPNGTPIPLYKNNARAGYRKDGDGNTILTKLDESTLMQIAAAARGEYIRATNSDDGLKLILNQITKMEKKNFGVKEFADYVDRFQYFLFAALLLMIAEFFVTERKSKWLVKINLFGEEKKCKPEN
jgi:Ca-activated chloride channel family protein